MLAEIGKLDAVRAAGLPDGLLSGIAPKVIAAWRARAAVEAPSHLRSHPRPLMLTLLAALVYERQREITDTRADLLSRPCTGSAPAPRGTSPRSWSPSSARSPGRGRCCSGSPKPRSPGPTTPAAARVHVPPPGVTPCVACLARLIIRAVRMIRQKLLSACGSAGLLMASLLQRSA
jgi:hypothetical protein